MKLSSPILELDCKASAELISYSIPKLENKSNPFMILSESELTYVQVLWMQDGYVVEYQNGSIDRHFVLGDYLTANEVVKLLESYLAGNNDWQYTHEAWRKNLRGFWGNLGYVLGSFFGNVVNGWRDVKSK